MRDFIPSILMAICVLAAILVAELRPPNSGTVIAVLGPETTIRQTIAETDAYLLGQSKIPNGYVLFSKDPDFPDRLKQAGATWVLNAAYSGGCVTKQSNIPSS